MGGLVVTYTSRHGNYQDSELLLKIGFMLNDTALAYVNAAESLCGWRRLEYAK